MKKFFAGLSLLVCSTATAQTDARLFRFPNVSQNQIAFVYGGNILACCNLQQTIFNFQL